MASLLCPLGWKDVSGFQPETLKLQYERANHLATPASSLGSFYKNCEFSLLKLIVIHKNYLLLEIAWKFIAGKLQVIVKINLKIKIIVKKTSEKWNAICFEILLIFDSNEVLFVGINFYVNLVLGIITGTDREPSMLTLVSRLRSRDIGRCSVYQYFA